MSARILIIILSLIGLAFRLIKMRLADLQRKQPLPAEVADIYDKERYQQYLNYVADKRKSQLLFAGINMVLDAFLVLSGMYEVFENATGKNPYLVLLLTLAVFTAVETITDTAEKYQNTFHIEEKYGLNKQTKKDFAKDTILGILQNILITGGLLLLLAFIGEHLAAWTSGFTVPLWKALLITLSIAAVILGFTLLASLFSLWVLKKQYTFTPMPEGELRSKIVALQEGSKKKVKQIYIYDESKKTTTKNAFLLKLLWHREFGVADNFINENAEEELLAVLSHEIGHLKHKKNLLNYLGYAELALLFVAIVWLIYQPQLILLMNAWIRASFSITTNNYYVWFAVVSMRSPVYRILLLMEAIHSLLLAG